MNNEQNKNVASRGPLIFTVAASHFPFLVALNVGWLDATERTAQENVGLIKRRAVRMSNWNCSVAEERCGKNCTTGRYREEAQNMRKRNGNR
jgi:hypothetical protein